MAIGIVQVTDKLAKTDNIDSCPKSKIIIGIENTKADKVITKASLMAKVSGRKENNLLKNHWQYIIQITAKKLKCKLIS